MFSILRDKHGIIVPDRVPDGLQMAPAAITRMIVVPTIREGRFSLGSDLNAALHFPLRTKRMRGSANM